MEHSFEHISFRLDYLEKWREIAIRPSPQDCNIEDEVMLCKEDDDLFELSRLCLDVRKQLNVNLPPHELALDDILVVRGSTIPNAGSGLFYEPSGNSDEVVKAGSTMCYCTGHRHNFFSQKSLSDRSYLMNVAGDILVDPGPMLSIKARYINDPLNEEIVNCKFVADPAHFRCAVVATRDIRSGEELFVSYGDMYWSQQSYLGTVKVGSVAFYNALST